MAWEAKLVNGNTYTLNKGRGAAASKVFRKDEWVSVTDDEREYLEENATQRITQKQGDVISTLFIAKFEFREAGSAKDTGEDGGKKPAAARRRNRKS